MLPAINPVLGDLLSHASQTAPKGLADAERSTFTEQADGAIVSPYLPANAAVSIEEAVAEAFATSQGVLCLTRTRNHLLMWAHYGEGHKGMLLEFNEHHSCFRRQSGKSKFQGRLMPVTYDDSRPQVSAWRSEAFGRSLSTKALEWAYEQEVRLFWQLAEADKTVGNDAHGRPIHLYATPAAALVSVTLGARVTSHYVATVRESLAATSLTKHVNLWTAEVDRAHFRINYVPSRLV